jgi:hypothetical protein
MSQMSHCTQPTMCKFFCFKIEIKPRLTRTCHAKQWPTPPSISNSKCYTWIYAGFSHCVTQSCESKTHRFPSTCGSTGTWKYLWVLKILNRNKVVNCKYKYMWNQIISRHGVTLWQNQIWHDQPCTSYHQHALSSHLHSIPFQKHCKL